MLIQLARIEGIPGIEFRGHAQMHKPVVLQRFPEIAGGVGRHVRTDLGDALQFLLSLGVCLLLCQLLRLFRVAFRETDQSVSADVHGLELLLLAVGFRIVEVIQAIQASLDVGFEIQKSLVIDLVVQNRVAGRPLLHELGEDTGLVCGFPFFRHFLEDEIAHGFALPERDNGVLVNSPGWFADGEGDLFPRVEDVKILQAMAAQFGVGRRGFGSGAFFAHDELALVDADGLVFHQILKGQGAAHGRRHQPMPGVLPVELSHQLCPLGRNGGPGVQALLPQAGDSFSHRHGSTSYFHLQAKLAQDLCDLSHPPIRRGADSLQATNFVQQPVFVNGCGVIGQEAHLVHVGQSGREGP